MKKKFFYLAMALCVAMTWTACGDDEDDNSSNSDSQWAKNVTLSKPDNFDYALDITIKEADLDKVTVTSSVELPEKPEVTGLDITEGGKVFVELTTTVDGRRMKSYPPLPVMTAEIRDNARIYKLSDNGKIEVQGLTLTRASQDVSLSFTFTLPMPDGTSLTISTGNTAVLASALVYATQNQLLGYLARTWNVSGLMLETSGSVSTPFVRFSGGNLANVRDEAVKHGADFTAEEAAQFNNVIKYVDFSSGNLFIGYNNGEVDAFDYVALNTTGNELKLTVKDASMGNKFLNNSSKVSATFEGNQCLLQFTTTVTGQKTYDATLSIQLTAAK